MPDPTNPDLPTREEIEASQRVCREAGAWPYNMQANVDFGKHAGAFLPRVNAAYLELLDRLEKSEKRCELQGRLIAASRKFDVIVSEEMKRLRAELAALEGG